MCRAALPVLAPLSGPASAFLVPIFLLRSALDRCAARLAQGLLLGSMAALQLLVVLLNPEPSRSIGIGPRLLALVVYEKQLLLPLFGFQQALQFISGLDASVRVGAAHWAPMPAFVAAAL